MSRVEHRPLLDRNRAFAADPAARQGMPRLPFIPNLNLYIVTCIDCRVEVSARSIPLSRRHLPGRIDHFREAGGLCDRSGSD
jgi:hypothetical protein